MDHVSTAADSPRLRTSREWAADPLPDEVVVWGAKGHSLMILQGIQDYWHGRVRVRAMVDEEEHGGEHPILRVPVVSAEVRLRDHADVPVLLGLSNTAARLRVWRQVLEEGGSVTGSYGDPDNLSHPSVRLGEGSIVARFTRIGAGTTIGAACQVLGTMVAHDVSVGDGTNIGVYASVLGNVRIGRQVNVAPHAIIHNGREGSPLTIGDGAVVGVGAVVTKDVPPGGVVVGNPAMSVDEWRRLRRLAAATEQER